MPAMPAQKIDPASKAPKFGPVSKPGIFLGYRLEPGGQWKGDYYVADLEHFRNGFSRPSVHQVKRIWRNPEEGYVFPMLAAYERLTREVQLLDTGEGKGLPKADAPIEPDDQLSADGPGSDHPKGDSSDPAVDSEAPADVPERVKSPNPGTDTMSMLGKHFSGMIDPHCLLEARPKRMWMIFV